MVELFLQTLLDVAVLREVVDDTGQSARDCIISGIELYKVI